MSRGSVSVSRAPKVFDARRPIWALRNLVADDSLGLSRVQVLPGDRNTEADAVALGVLHGATVLHGWAERTPTSEDLMALGTLVAEGAAQGLDPWRDGWFVAVWGLAARGLLTSAPPTVAKHLNDWLTSTLGQGVSLSWLPRLERGRSPDGELWIREVEHVGDHFWSFRFGDGTVLVRDLSVPMRLVGAGSWLDPQFGEVLGEPTLWGNLLIRVWPTPDAGYAFMEIDAGVLRENDKFAQIVGAHETIGRKGPRRVFRCRARNFGSWS